MRRETPKKLPQTLGESPSTDSDRSSKEDGEEGLHNGEQSYEEIDLENLENLIKSLFEFEEQETFFFGGEIKARTFGVNDREILQIKKLKDDFRFYEVELAPPFGRNIKINLNFSNPAAPASGITNTLGEEFDHSNMKAIYKGLSEYKQSLIDEICKVHLEKDSLSIFGIELIRADKSTGESRDSFLSPSIAVNCLKKKESGKDLEIYELKDLYSRVTNSGLNNAKAGTSLTSEFVGGEAIVEKVMVSPEAKEKAEKTSTKFFSQDQLDQALIRHRHKETLNSVDKRVLIEFAIAEVYKKIEKNKDADKINELDYQKKIIERCTRKSRANKTIKSEYFDTVLEFIEENHSWGIDILVRNNDSKKTPNSTAEDPTASKFTTHILLLKR